MNSLRKWRFLVPIAAVALLLWPWSYLASPRWDVFVVDGKGQPREGANVRLVYQNYSVEGHSHELNVQTDTDWRVSFPPQCGRATLVERGYYTVSAALAGVHASFGRHTYVLVLGKDYKGMALPDWHGAPESVQSKVVVN